MQSILFRRQGKYVLSDQTLLGALEGIICPTVRTACLVGELRLSLAENSILRNEYVRAEAIVDGIETIDNTHLLVTRLLERKWTAKARIFRFMGKFAAAVDPLRSYLGVRRTFSRSSHCHVVRVLANVYVELQRFASAEQPLDCCLSGMSNSQKTHPRAYNRLLLSKADIEIAQSRYNAAEKTLHQVASSFKIRPPVTQTDQLDHVRTAIAALRIMMHTGQWTKAQTSSTQAFELTESYTSFTKTNYYKGYITQINAMSRVRLAAADFRATASYVQSPVIS